MSDQLGVAPHGSEMSDGSLPFRFPPLALICYGGQMDKELTKDEVAQRARISATRYGKTAATAGMAKET
jgi:hypothetical protein